MAEEVRLELRMCACQCGKSFMVMPNSKHIYFSKAHDKTKKVREIFKPNFNRRQLCDPFEEFIKSIDDIEE